MIAINLHNQLEWSRMAQDAYSHSFNWLGHKMSGAASLPLGTRLDAKVYDEYATLYRAWLIDGLDAFNMQATESGEA